MFDKLVVRRPHTEEEMAEYERIGRLYWQVRMSWMWN